MSEASVEHAALNSSDLVATARRHGGYVWLEDRISQLFGVRAHAGGDSSFVRWAGEVAGIHRWHAQMWTDRLPQLRELPIGDLIADQSYLATLLDTAQSIEQLDALHQLYWTQILDALNALYTEELGLLGAVDSPMSRRWIDLVLHSIELQRSHAENLSSRA